MKVIDLKDRTIFVDDIIQLYSEDYSPRRYKLETKNGIYCIDKEDYFNVRCYLLSLNDEVEVIEEDKKIEPIKYEVNKVICLDTCIEKINEIIDRINNAN